MRFPVLAVFCLLGGVSGEEPKDKRSLGYVLGVDHAAFNKEFRLHFPVTVEKKVPVPVHVHIDKPFPVYVPKPYLVPVEKRVPYPVQVPVPHPYPVEKKIPVPVEVPVDNPVPYPVEKPYPVFLEKKVPYPVEKRVPVAVKYYVIRPYPVRVPYVKHVPYLVERPVPAPYNLPVDRPLPYPVEKPVPVPVYVPTKAEGSGEDEDQDKGYSPGQLDSYGQTYNYETSERPETEQSRNLEERGYGRNGYEQADYKKYTSLRTPEVNAPQYYYGDQKSGHGSWSSADGRDTKSEDYEKYYYPPRAVDYAQAYRAAGEESKEEEKKEEEGSQDGQRSGQLPQVQDAYGHWASLYGNLDKSGPWKRSSRFRTPEKDAPKDKTQ